tara:strand:+ start:15 stop:485 length:471 start_codon:yes stop_codon:yes gene_type:complete
MTSPRALPDFSRLSLGALQGTDLGVYGLTPEQLRDAASVSFLKGSPDQMRTRFNTLLTILEHQHTEMSSKVNELRAAIGTDPDYNPAALLGLGISLQALKTIARRMLMRLGDNLPGTRSEKRKFGDLTKRLEKVKGEIDATLRSISAILAPSEGGA